MSSDLVYDNLQYKDRSVYSVVDDAAAGQQKQARNTSAKDVKECKRKIFIWKTATIISSFFTIMVIILAVAFYFIKCKKQDSTGLRKLNADICVKAGIENEMNCSYCDQNWIYYSGNCYFLSMRQLNWKDSQNNCKNMSSNLVVVKNAEEEAFVERIVQQKTWIGLSKKISGGWIWEDGSILQGNGFWLPYEPNDENGVEGCVELFPFYNINGWNDENCNSERQSLCKRPSDVYRMFYFI